MANIRHLYRTRCPLCGVAIKSHNADAFNAKLRAHKEWHNNQPENRTK